LSGNTCVGSLSAGSTCSTSATFTPTAAGARSAAITYTDNATGSPQTIALSGTGQVGTMTLSAAPASLTFALRNTGTTSAAQGVTITNTVNSPVSFTSVTLTGANPGD